MKAKAAELSQSLPLSRFEQEKINLEKAWNKAAKKAEQEKINLEKARDKAAEKAEQVKLDKEKARNVKKTEIDVII